MSNKNPPHLLSAVNAPNLTRLLLRYGFQPRQLPRIAFLYWSAFLSSPFRWLDRLKSTATVKQTKVHQPVFIIGHWRSGTTHLHNLMCQDEQFGWVSNFHCAAASSFLGAPGLSRYLIGDRLPNSRPMDSMNVTFDGPQEEELALARMSPYSFHHCFHFPKQMREIFEQVVLFEGNPAIVAKWKKLYVKFVRRVTIDCGGKPLCLKNPANTARTPQLLEMFPDARFIHIYRDPFDVYPSTTRLWDRLLSCWSLQAYDPQTIRENTIHFYRELMNRYFTDRDKIPPGQLVEIRYEDLEQDPLTQLERVYFSLNLDGFHNVERRFESYLNRISGYQKNIYASNRLESDLVSREWRFAIEALGYDSPKHDKTGPLSMATDREIKP
jgi:hypothetical protein